MHNQKIIIGIGGNIKSEDGDHPIKVGMKAIKYLKEAPDLIKLLV